MSTNFDYTTPVIHDAFDYHCPCSGCNEARERPDHILTVDPVRRDNLRHLSAWLASHQGWEWDQVNTVYNDGYDCEYEYLDGYHIVGHVTFEREDDGGGEWVISVPTDVVYERAIVKKVQA